MTAPLKKYIVTRERCPACESARSVTLYRASYTETPIRDYLAWFYSTTGKGVEFEYLEGSEYILEECQDCGLIYQKGIPGPALTHRLYEQWLDPEVVRQIVSRKQTARFFLLCSAEITRVIEYLNRLPSEIRFLDFGMGWGNWCFIAKGFGCDVYGMEISDTRKEHAAASGITVVGWDDLAHQRFHFINAEQVFEHLADPLETLSRLGQALEPGGIIRVNVPSGFDIKHKLQKPDWLVPASMPATLNDVAPLQHLNCFNFESLVRMGRKAGLEEVEVAGDLLRPQGYTALVKAAIRPYFHALFPGIHEARRRQSTNLCFRLATPLAHR